MTIASWTNKKVVRKLLDDPLIALPLDGNKNKFSTKFLPDYKSP